jgi:predicted TIM-barrel fold metal-dependent hydrolase
MGASVSETGSAGIPAITDAHIHLWDLGRLSYPWLTDRYDEKLAVGPYRAICRDILIPDLQREAVSLPLKKFVHIAAAIGHPDAVEETRFIDAHAAQHGFKIAIIANEDLRMPHLGRRLNRHAETLSFRGIRALSGGSDLWANPILVRNLADLQAADILYELDVQFPHYASACRALRQCEGLRVVIDHAGMPVERSRAHFLAWRKGMKELAAAPNVACKISGLGTHDHNWTTDSIRPWVEAVIEMFGCTRTMFASDWPVSSLHSTYEALFTAYSEITASLGSEQRRQLFSGTADAWYRI